MTSKLNQAGYSLTIKAFLTGGLILAMMIPALYVQNLVEERKQRQDEVIQEVSSKWAYKQVLAGPYLSIPYSYTTISGDNKTTTVEKNMIVLPETLEVNGAVEPQFKKRGIYKVALYQTDVKLQGQFNLSGIKPEQGETIHWQRARLCFGVSDTRGIEAQPAGTMQGQNLVFESGVPTNLLASKGASAAIDVSGFLNATSLPYLIPLQLRGSESLEILPTGKSTTVNLQSPWSSPSFIGKFLPEHDTNTDGFNASWKVLHFNRDFPQVWKNHHYAADEFAFGLSLIQPTDNYAKTMRSVKYAILFIGLTFGFFFLLELLQGHRVHPVQYILTGLALVVFYTLLLSIGEVLTFNIAYAIAALATTLLIMFYGKHLFVYWKNAAFIGGFLGSLYVFIFVLIQLEDTSLLAGSIGLFILVALAMQLSKKIKWYQPLQATVPVVAMDPHAGI